MSFSVGHISISCSDAISFDNKKSDYCCSDRQNNSPLKGACCLVLAISWAETFWVCAGRWLWWLSSSLILSRFVFFFVFTWKIENLRPFKYQVNYQKDTENKNLHSFYRITGFGRYWKIMEILWLKDRINFGDEKTVTL